MTVTPHDIGTFRVQSGSRPDMEHLVDLAYREEPWNKPVPWCGCEECHAKGHGYCKHLIAVIAFLHEAT